MLTIALVIVLAMILGGVAVEKLQHTTNPTFAA
jgi:hypothetical protein